MPSARSFGRSLPPSMASKRASQSLEAIDGTPIVDSEIVMDVTRDG
jgi:hypothetical protein